MLAIKNAVLIMRDHLIPNAVLLADQGKIVEDGTYEELIARNGFFAELVARQQLDGPDPGSGSCGTAES